MSCLRNISVHFLCLVLFRVTDLTHNLSMISSSYSAELTSPLLPLLHTLLDNFEFQKTWLNIHCTEMCVCVCVCVFSILQSSWMSLVSSAWSGEILQVGWGPIMIHLSKLHPTMYTFVVSMLLYHDYYYAFSWHSFVLWITELLRCTLLWNS